MQRVLTVVGDPNLINTWSNIPYFFLKAGQERGFLDAGLPLNPEKLKTQRLVWNLWKWLQTGERGGFQYSPLFLKQLFAQAQLNSDSIEIISHFPLLPPAPWASNWKVNFYIDATLAQIFDDYGLGKKISKRMQKEALKQEQKNYFNATKIICMSHWAATSVVNDYGINPSKVHVIPGGANLDENCIPQIDEQSQQPISVNPLNLGFVGKDWQRKGLPFLLSIAEVLHSRGCAVKVTVVGPSSRELPSHPLMQSVGFIDKSQDLQQYVDIVQSFHFGCLFSSAEAFGFSNIECLRLGVPVLANRVGGIPATVPEGLGFLVEPDSSPIEVADLLKSFINNPTTYQSLRQRVVDRSLEFSWDQTISNFTQVWQGSDKFSYGKI